MRIFSIIMTVVLLAIGFVPCKDSKVVFGKEKTELTAQHHDGQHSEDGCSPFCVCACCSLQSVHASLVQLVPTADMLVAVYTLPGTDDVQELSRPIWQPPQLAA